MPIVKLIFRNLILPCILKVIYAENRRKRIRGACYWLMFICTILNGFENFTVNIAGTLSNLLLLKISVSTFEINYNNIYMSFIFLNRAVPFKGTFSIIKRSIIMPLNFISQFTTTSERTI